MPSPTPQELKKLLVSDGLEVYRTVGERVILADRVRDNLIMDSGVSAVAGSSGLTARVIMRAQACDFQGETPEKLFGHARALGAQCQAAGYAEVSTAVVPIHDPGDRSRVLDTWYEVAFEHDVADEAELLEALRTALTWVKVATRGAP
jgi:hypothetical protein